MRPIRVAHLMPFPVEYFVPLYRELASRPEIELTVFYFSDATTREFYDPGFGRRIEWDIPLLDGYRSRFLPSARRTRLADGFLRRPNWDVVREVASGRYDVIWTHGYGHLTTWLAALVARPRGTRLMLREAQNLLHRRPWHRRAVKRVALSVLLQGAVGAYVGEHAHGYLRHYGIPEERLFAAPHCVDNRFFQEQSSALATRRDEVRRSFGIDDDAPVVLFCGKLSPEKEPLGLLEAFERVQRGRPCWLLLVGDGPLRGAAEELVERRGLRGVRFAGFVNQGEIATAYAAADLFVLPSSYEVWGMVVNEALNFSLPLVVSDKVGSAPDLVRSGWNGFVVPARDVEALAEAIGALVADPELRRAYGERSRELADSYSVERCADGIVAACLALAAGRRAFPVVGQEEAAC